MFLASRGRLKLVTGCFTVTVSKKAVISEALRVLLDKSVPQSHLSLPTHVITIDGQTVSKSVCDSSM